MSMKFRAKLMGVGGLEKPQEVFGNSDDMLGPWIKDTLDKYPDGWVEITEYAARVIGAVPGEKCKTVVPLSC
jgi:hypothetical protein